jgi:membrane-associated phospholipid phosphatase
LIQTQSPIFSAPTPTAIRRWFRLFGPVRLLLCGLAALVVIWIEQVVLSQQEPAFDEAVLVWLGDRIPESLGRFLVIVYQVSGTRFTAMLVLAALIFLLIKRSWNQLIWVAIGTSGILLIVDRWLKPQFDRARPLGRLVEVIGRSFPSGHAAGAVVFYFLMCTILAERYPHLRRPLVLGSALWVGLIWVSTLYCRVHWLTDIIAGAAVGFIWLSICLTSLRFCADRQSG